MGLFSNIFKNKLTVGVDMGTSTIKVVAIKPGKNLQLVTCGVKDIPPGAITNGEIVNTQVAVDLLTQFKDELNLAGCRVVCGIGGSKVVVRHIRMPVMTSKELASAMQWEAKKYLPYAEKQAITDYVNLGEVSAGGQKQLLVLLAAVPREVAYAYHHVFDVAGMRLIAIDIAPLALRRWLLAVDSLSMKGDSKVTVAIIDIGFGDTNFVICQGPRVTFARTIAFGGASLAGDVARINKIDLDGAQKFVKEEGKLVAPARESGAMEEIQLDMVLRNRLDELVRELRRSFDFYRTQTKETGIDMVILAGGVARLPGLPQYLQEHLAIPVEVGLLDLGDGPVLEPSFAVAAGLALRGAIN